MYALACCIALPLTIGILFLMTKLILPIDSDPVVMQMLHKLELQRDARQVLQQPIHVYERPSRIEESTPPDKFVEDTSRPIRPPTSDDDPAPDPEPHVVDWWAEARSIVQDSEDANFEEWLLAQGYRKYVSIMQGPMPTGDNPSKSPAQRENENIGYRNVFGDLELTINDNCVMRMQSGTVDLSDFSRHLPAQVICKSSPKIDLSGLRRQEEPP